MNVEGQKKFWQKTSKCWYTFWQKTFKVLVEPHDDFSGISRISNDYNPTPCLTQKHQAQLSSYLLTTERCINRISSLLVKLTPDPTHGFESMLFRSGGGGLNGLINFSSGETCSDDPVVDLICMETFCELRSDQFQEACLLTY